MPTKKTTGAYIVANPRGIPQGAYIIRNETKRWYEGDSVSPDDFDKKAWDRWVKGGFVKEAD